MIENRSMAIANEFIQRATRDGISVTQMKLQKLVFLANGWNWAINGDQLVSEMPQAWDYGPVYPDLYRHTRFFGRRPIDRPITPDDDDNFRFFGAVDGNAPAYQSELSLREKAVLDNVWDRYKNLSAFKLSDLTHKPNTPWHKTYFRDGERMPIKQTLIAQHYDELLRSAA